QEYARAYAIERSIKSLEADLRSIERQLWKLRSAEEQIERKGKILNRLLQGSVDGNVLMAMGFFTNLLSADAFEGFKAEVPPIAASDFTLVYGYRQQCDPITDTCERQEIEFNDFPGGNVWQFIEWLRPQAVK